MPLVNGDQVATGAADADTDAGAAGARAGGGDIRAAAKRDADRGATDSGRHRRTTSAGAATADTGSANAEIKGHRRYRGADEQRCRCKQDDPDFSHGLLLQNAIPKAMRTQVGRIRRGRNGIGFDGRLTECGGFELLRREGRGSRPIPSFGAVYGRDDAD